MKALELQNELEQQMFNDFISMMQNDLLNSIMIVVIKEIFQDNKRILQNIIDQWSINYFNAQMESVKMTYNQMTPEQKQKVVPYKRHEEIFGWCVNSVKMNWENMLGLKQIIVTN